MNSRFSTIMVLWTTGSDKTIAGILFCAVFYDCKNYELWSWSACHSCIRNSTLLEIKIDWNRNHGSEWSWQEFLYRAVFMIKTVAWSWHGTVTVGRNFKCFHRHHHIVYNVSSAAQSVSYKKCSIKALTQHSGWHFKPIQYLLYNSSVPFFQWYKIISINFSMLKNHRHDGSGTVMTGIFVL